MTGKRKPVTFTVNERGCHICTSHVLGTSGYPCIWKDGRNQNMHRVLYEEAHGPLLPDQVVRHVCDDRTCINLKHLVPGTRKQNTADMMERNRQNPPVGERAGNAKLTAQAVADIRRSAETQRVLASRYGVTQSTISKTRSGQRWAQELSK